ncbi:hypothetical protein LMH87_006006 [Akanthomyces muscarius]|uniref:JmjC domain-containing protein n=1 Tax=Akanthomyces muscarius TaxID=2231603 RepID=A0A9W8QPZ3_AKAMU|nr:hypothetical protein LMH87_006006 [Akanthomyces muscarius]KAJ4164329.1 hypothetical protein LMH87_006006 [Akanthomyces muscarius]
MAAATMEWPVARPDGYADAYVDDDDDDDTVVLVEYPGANVQQRMPAAPPADSTTAEADQDGPVAGTTSTKSSSAVGGRDIGSSPANTQPLITSVGEADDDTPATEEDFVPPKTSAEDIRPAATTPPRSPTVTTQPLDSTVTETGDEAPAEQEDSLPPTASTEDTRLTATTPPPPSTATTLEPPNSTATIASSDMDSVRSQFSSPLLQRAEHVDAPESPLSDVSDIAEFDYDYDEASGGHRLIRLKPTAAQWDDFPALLAFARKLGACEDGCFKLKLPADLQGPLPSKAKQTLPANAYKAKLIRRTTFWQLSTVRAEGEFYSPADVDVEPSESVDDTLKTLKTIFHRNKGRQMRNVRYRPDVPAWNSDQRREAGVPPDWSPIHPLRGDMLDRTKAVIPGIHTPYVYESAPHFGATFQIHAEDYRLLSLNHLYRGRKIWIVVPCTAIDVAEKALGRGADGCSQFMRHRAEFFFPEKLDKLGIPYRIVDQRPGETIVILPDAYHEGYSTGYTLAEAKNYADEEWSTETYKPCAANCQLLTAIPADYMRIMSDGEERLDLCALHDQQVAEELKRTADEMELGDHDAHDGEAKRIKVE